MRTIAVLLLVFAAGRLRAQDQPTGQTKPVEVSVRGADLRHIEFDIQTGRLSFSVGGHRYVLAGRAQDAGGYEAVAAAKLGILNELRRCDQVTMSVTYTDGQSQPGYIVAMVLKYDSFRP